MKRTVGVLLGLLVLLTLIPTQVALADLDNGCPVGKYNTAPTSNLVSATTSVSSNTVTYIFKSFTNQNPVGGAPGLVEYCVYSDTQPSSATVVTTGDDGGAWQDPPAFDNFSYGRTGGTSNNVGMDGVAHTIGTATWNSGVPGNYNRIVLHIDDAAECERLGQASATCFVLPGQAAEASALAITKTAAGSYDRTYKWSIDKTADETAYTAGGADGQANFKVSVSHDDGTDSNVKVTGKITVTNPNSANVAITSVTDKLSDNTACTVTGGGAQSLTPGAHDFNYSCSLSAVPASALTNTATVSYAEQTLTDGSHLAAGPQSFTTGTISFTKTDVDECITVDDTNSAGPQDVEVCLADAPKDFEYKGTVSGDEGTCTPNHNTASFVTNDTETEDSAKATVSDCQGADLIVTKTATPAYDLKYKWEIDKSVADPKHVDLLPGETKATFNYSVKVTHDTGTAGNWTVTGKITVQNPNDWQDITMTSLTDATNNGGSCTVDTSGGLTVAKSSSKEYPYSCTYASAPSPTDGTNTATANWSKTTYHTPNGSDTGTAPVTFSTVTPNTIDECIDVKDSLQGTLGTVCVGDPNPKTFTYSREVPAPASGECVTVDNTADFKTNDTETTGTDKESVEVCSPVEDNPRNPAGSIFGPCGDPSYAGVFDNRLSTEKLRFKFTWRTTLGLNKIVKMVPGGAMYKTVLRWAKPNTVVRVFWQDPDTGVWNLLDSKTAVKGRYGMCNDWVPGWTYVS